MSQWPIRSHRPTHNDSTICRQSAGCQDPYESCDCKLFRHHLAIPSFSFFPHRHSYTPTHPIHCRTPPSAQFCPPPPPHSPLSLLPRRPTCHPRRPLAHSPLLPTQHCRRTGKEPFLGLRSPPSPRCIKYASLASTHPCRPSPPFPRLFCQSFASENPISSET